MAWFLIHGISIKDYYQLTLGQKMAIYELLTEGGD